MGKSYEEVDRIKERLSESYFDIGKNKDNYILGVGVSNVRLNDPHADSSILEDLCICVFVRLDIEPSFEVPEEVDGVRIYKIKGYSCNALRKRNCSSNAP